MPAQTAPKGARDRALGQTYGSGGSGGPTARPSKTDRTRKKRKAPLWTKLITAFGAVIIVLSVSGIVGVRYFLGQLTENIQTTSSVLGDEAGTAGNTKAGDLPDGAMNMLLLGLDTREGWEESGKLSRSDTIIILHINAARDAAYMISIPRDTVTQIPSDKSLNFGGATSRINSAYTFGSDGGRGWTGGAKLATKAVHELTGIGFDGVMIIDFAGFRGMLEAMGGVRLCVDKRMWSSHYIVKNGKVEYAKGADPKSPPRNALWFEKGCRTMAPWEALEFSRLRHSDNGDYDRQRHQQQLLRAMAKKATSAGIITNPTKVGNILKAAGSSLRMDTHGVSVNDFIFGMKVLAAANLIPIKTNNGTFAAGESGGEGITQETRELFKATSEDRIAEFLADNPDMLINDATGAP